MNADYFDRIYDSIEDYAADARPDFDGMSALVDFNGGITGPDHLRRMIEDGWSEGVERARMMGLALSDYIPSLGITGLEEVEDYDVSGADVDVGAFCDGEPECMVETVEKVQPRSRVVRVVVQINYMCEVPAASAMRRGVALAAVVDALETAGLRVEVWTLDSCISNSKLSSRFKDHNHWRTATLVKEAATPLPIDRLAFAIGHPGYFRGLTFAVRKNLIGTANASTASLLSYNTREEVGLEPGDLLIEALTWGATQKYFESDETAATWVVEKFTEIITQALEAQQ